MHSLMAVILNDVAQLEYDRGKQLPPQQELYLEKMDQKMDDGLQLGDEVIQNPDLNQRVQFVAGNLAHAILNDEEATAAALCAYLATRLPDLKQVKIDNRQGGQPGDIAIELVFDEDYKKQVAVQFFH